MSKSAKKNAKRKDKKEAENDVSKAAEAVNSMRYYITFKQAGCCNMLCVMLACIPSKSTIWMACSSVYNLCGLAALQTHLCHMARHLASTTRQSQLLRMQQAKISQLDQNNKMEMLQQPQMSGNMQVVQKHHRTLTSSSGTCDRRFDRQNLQQAKQQRESNLQQRSRKSCKSFLLLAIRALAGPAGVRCLEYKLPPSYLLVHAA